MRSKAINQIIKALGNVAIKKNDKKTRKKGTSAAKRVEYQIGGEKKSAALVAHLRII